MHEMSICQNMMEILEQQFARDDINKVTDVWLELGAMSCVEPQALEFCFEISCRNTPAEGCKLHFITIPMQAWCWQCEKMVEIQPNNQCCPHCGGQHLQVQHGNELRIKEIAVI